MPDELIERVSNSASGRPTPPKARSLDGYPRTVGPGAGARRPAGWPETGRRLEFVLRLDVDDKTLIDRLLRRAHEQHRSDDNPESIAERLAEYHQLTEPVIGY